MSRGRSDRTTADLAAALGKATGSEWAYLWRKLQERADAGPELARVLRELPSEPRKKAIAMLGTTPAASAPEVVSALVDALRDDQVRTRQAAVQKLGELRAAGAVDALAEVMRTAPPEVRVDVVRALGAIGDERAVPPIVAALRDEDDGVRAAAAEALYDVAATEAGPALREALADPAPAVRQWAARALGRLGEPGAEAALRSLSADPAGRVRRAGERAVADLRGESRAAASNGGLSLAGSWYSDPTMDGQTYVYTFRDDGSGEVEDINLGLTNEQTPFTYRRRDGVLEFRFGKRRQPVETRFRVERGSFREPYQGEVEAAVLVFDREPYFTRFGPVEDATYYRLVG